MREAKKSYRETKNNAPETNVSYYLVLRFEGQKDKSRFLRAYA